MKIIEFGTENTDVIILLHGGGLSWWNYRDEADLLKGNYHVVLPVRDGHAESGISFSRIEDNAKELIHYIDENFGGLVLAIGGLSLGAQTLVEMLSQRKDICRFALIESALVIPMPFTNALISPMFEMSYGIISNKKFAKLQFDTLKIKPDLFDDYYKDTCKIKKQDMINFLKANSSYKLKDSLKNTTAKVLVIAGGKEQQKMIRSAKLLSEIILNSSLSIIDNYYHGELSLNHPEDYVNLITQLIKGKKAVIKI